MRKSFKALFFLTVTSLVAVFLVPQGVFAVTYTFSNGGINNGEWTETSNWDQGIVPSSGDDVVINAPVLTDSSGSASVNGITVNDGASLGISITAAGTVSFNSGSANTGSLTANGNVFLYSGSANNGFIGVSGAAYISCNATGGSISGSTFNQACVTNVSSNSSGGPHTAGDIIYIDVTFSQSVTITSGTPTLNLNTGRVVDYFSGSGTNVLTFSYQVQPGEYTTDLDYADSSALQNGGISSSYGSADIGLPVPGASGSLGANNDISIDARLPTLTSAVVSGTYLTLTYDRTLDPSSVPSTAPFAVNINGSGVDPLAVLLSGKVVTVTLDTTVQVGDVVTVDYTQGAGGSNSIRREDIPADEAITFSNQAVTNSTLALYRHSASGRAYWQSITSSSDGTKLAAVESRISSLAGYLYTSSDSGISWTRRRSAGIHEWHTIAYSPDGTKLFAATDNAIYRSTDSGVTWSQVFNHGTTAGASVAIAASSNGTYVVAGNGVDLYVSTDSGDTWNTTLSASGQIFDGVTISSDGSRMAATSYGAKTYTSSDYGSTWIDQLGFGGCNCAAIASSADGSQLIVVAPPQVYKSTDYGVNWTNIVPVTSQGADYEGSVISSADGMKLAYTERFGGIQFSADGGLTWTLEPNTTTGAFYALAGSSDLSKIVGAAYQDSILGQGSYIYGNTKNPPALTSFTSSSGNGTYTTGQSINITANFDENIGAGATMTVVLNTGASVVLNQRSSSHLSGTYVVGGGETTLDLTVASISSASVPDSTAASTGTVYVVPSSPELTGNANGNIGDSSNIVIGTTCCTIPVGTNPYAMATVGNIVYVANQGSNSISVIDITTNTVIATTTVGTQPYGMAYNVSTKEIYVANIQSDNVSVIDADPTHSASLYNHVISTISLAASSQPYYVASLGNKVYVTGATSNSVFVITASTHTYTGIAITVGTAPRGIKAHGTDLYVANFGSTYSGTAVGTVSVIDTTDHSGTSEGTVSTTTMVGSGARGVAVSGSEVYVANYNDNTVSVISTATNLVTHTIAVGRNPRGVLALGTKIYVENFNDGTISVIDTTGGSAYTVTATISVGNAPAGMTAVGTDIYVSLFTEGEVVILDTTSNALKTYCVPIVSTDNGGGGGGVAYSSSSGGSSYVPPVSPTPTPTLINPIPTPYIPPVAPVFTGTIPQGTFSRDLTLGGKGNDIFILQKFLNANGFIIANSGPGSPGHETLIFGYATQYQLKRFQIAHGIMPATGFFGPKTRAFIEGGVPAQNPSPVLPPIAVSGTFTRDLTLGNTGEDVLALQKYLNSNGYIIANSGPGSPGHETLKFGYATQYQLKQFQIAHGVTPATGFFGAKTRTLLAQ
jgi:YVTN family beta-propeller protein